MQSLLDALAEPAMRHAMVVHAPIGLAFAALAVALLAGLVTRVRGLRIATPVVFALFALAAWQAEESGEAARDAIPQTLSDETYALLSEHEELGERLPLIALSGLLLAALAFVPPPRLAVVGTWGAALVALVACAWVTWTAHHGGLLVYAHGVGVRPTLEMPRAAESDGDPRIGFFEQEVAPLLSARCQGCHNPARAGRAGELDQTTIRGLLEGGVSGPALVPGDPDASLLVQRVRTGDPEWIMPPEGEGNPLDDDEIAALERWIREGAVWPPR